MHIKIQLLSEACTKGDLKTLTDIIDKHPEYLKSTSHNGWTWLMMCCLYGHIQLVKYLLTKDTSLNYTDINYVDANLKWTSFFMACIGGNNEIVRLLLNTNKMNTINNIDKYGKTALKYAKNRRFFEIVKIVRQYQLKRLFRKIITMNSIVRYMQNSKNMYSPNSLSFYYEFGKNQRLLNRNDWNSNSDGFLETLTPEQLLWFNKGYNTE